MRLNDNPIHHLCADSSRTNPNQRTRHCPEKKLTGKQIFWCVVWAVVPVVNFFFMLLVVYAVIKQIKTDIDEYHGK